MPNIDLHLHPMLVHFPVALFVTACGLHILDLFLKKEKWCQSAWNIFIVAIFITPLAILTGLEEAEEHHLHHHVLDLHKMFAFFTAGIAVLSLPLLVFLRKKSLPVFNQIFLAFLLVITVTVSCTAYNGGRLVYEYGVGVGEEEHGH